MDFKNRSVLVTGAGGFIGSHLAERLVVTENTVKYHLRNILGKLHLKNRAQVVAYVMQHGPVNPQK